jgi:hypothetical protein
MNQTHKLKCLLLIIAMYILTGTQVLAQTQLFTQIPTDQAGLEVSQLEFLNTQVEKGYYTDFIIARVGNLIQNEENGEIFFTIPGKEGLMGAKAQRVDYQSSTDYYWFGNIEYHYPGYLNLVRSEDGISGFVHLEDHNYTFLPLGDNIIAIMTENNDLPLRCISKEFGKPKNPIEQKSCIVSDKCDANIDVLVLVTPEAKKYMISTLKKEKSKPLLLMQNI